MTFPIRKRIRTELFTDERAALFILMGARKVKAKLKKVPKRQ